MALVRATAVVSDAAGAGDASDYIALDFDQRHRRRIAMISASGREFLLDLPHAHAIADGDLLQLEDGTLIAVRALPEPVAEITARDTEHLARIAWHLGNRHLPTEILDGKLRIRDDHVIVAMVRGLGGHVEITSAPFQPEGGAYAHGHDHD